VDMANPTDISFVYNGLCPLSVKIIETLIAEKGIKNISSYIKTIGVPVTIPPQDEQDFWFKKPHAHHSKKKVMVYFVGGITYAEIAAIRFLNKLFENKEFVIATTSIINSSKILRQLTPEVDNGLDHLTCNIE